MADAVMKSKQLVGWGYMLCLMDVRRIVFYVTVTAQNAAAWLILGLVAMITIFYLCAQQPSFHWLVAIRMRERWSGSRGLGQNPLHQQLPRNKSV